MRKLLFAATLLTALAACKGGGDKAVTQDEIGLRQTDLFSEDVALGDKAKYSTTPPGTGQTLDRSYENAPPLVPHTLDGFVPITKDNNICVSCHMPNMAPATKATAIPKSHFTNYRYVMKDNNGVYEPVDDQKAGGTDLGDKLYAGRYNCTQCHVPQAQITVAVENLFTPEFRNELAKKKSNFADVVKEGVTEPAQ